MDFQNPKSLDFQNSKSLDFHHNKTIPNLVKNDMIISDKHCTMVGHQYIPEQKNCMAMAYERNMENFKFIPIIKAEFAQKFPGVASCGLNQFKTKTNRPPRIEF